MAREVFEFNTGSSHLDYSTLWRYDIHRLYNITTRPVNKCDVKTENGQFPEAWSWVEKANYDGRRMVNKIECFFWQAKVGPFLFTLAVRATNNEPIAFSSKSSQEYLQINFESWRSSAPSSSFFEVPSFCPK
eukprot:TRINITY_DN918_c0_g1_i3.p1 TRINITY_DN918_c0_g1~~TRINITY_DN918_c0_g1_i3.p1  ORF type:complete len:132 (-),score=16.78 TRINITY_DN918_c0_g1_i3:27-422(-)